MSDMQTELDFVQSQEKIKDLISIKYSKSTNDHKWYTQNIHL